MYELSVSQLVDGLRNGEFSSVELTQYYVDRMQKFIDLNAFITELGERAILQAAHADKLIKEKKYGLLTGIPIAHKDIFCMEGVKTSCGSKMLDNFYAPYDSTVVEKLDQAGCVTIGRTNMDEFAMGSSNETSYYGPVKNPWNTDCVPGGSIGRLSSCCSRAHCSFSHRHRYWWLDTSTCSLMRYYRLKAHIRESFTLRHDCLCV